MINAVSEELITEAVEIYPLLGVGLEAEMFLLKKTQHVVKFNTNEV